jgi:type I restriction enzyme S subunit
MNCNQAVCVIRPCEDLVDVRYLNFWLASEDARRQMSAGKVTGVISNFNLTKARELHVLLPSLPEQKQIADILDKADAIRSKRKRTIKLAEQFLRSTFIDMFGDPVINPRNWETVPVSHFVSKLEGGKNLKPAPEDALTKYYVLKVSAVTWGEYRAQECKPLPSTYSPPESHFVQKGDLLISRANTRELIGATAFVRDTPSNLVLPDKIWRFIWKSDVKVSPLFVHFLFSHQGIQSEIGRRASGSSGSMKNIAKPKLLSIEVPFPKFDLQKEFEDIVKKAWGTAEHQQTASKSSTALFNSLVQLAFKGEL